MSMPCIKSSDTRRRQAITDIIESVALEECAISHILNAEGEALQKVLSFQTLNIEHMISKNDSIVEVIRACTEFGKELCGKLKIFENCICCEDCID